MARKWPTYAACALIVQSLHGCADQPAQNAAAAAQRAEQRAGRLPDQRPSAPAADARLILAFGDSLYAGYGVAQDESFPHELEKALRARGMSVDVRNAGVSGETTQGGLQRLAFTLDGLPRKPDLVLLGLGGNDMLRGLDPAQTDRNLRAMLDMLKQRGLRVILTGMLAAPNLGPDYAARFNAIYPALAREYGVPLYPFFLDGVIGNPLFMQPDAIHPNPAGVDQIVGKIAPLVRKSLD